MNILKVLKVAYRTNVLFAEEAKLAFFRRNRKLIDNPKWDSLFRTAHNQGVEVIFFDSEKELLYLKKDGITVVIDDDYGVFIEILIDRVYMLSPQLTGNFCVFDVGMNRGLASLFFAANPNCTKIIGFELENSIYGKALQNFALNKTLAEKIVPYNFGLWNENGEIDVCTCETASYTGIASCISEQKHLTAKMQEKKLKSVVKATVKKSSEIFAPMLAEIKPDVKKVLKIDIEGAEYAVFEDLYRHNLLQQFDMIIGEAHNGLAGIEKYLDDFICVNKNYLFDLLITFCYINKRIT
jgi:FkbM family methyltransferase